MTGTIVRLVKDKNFGFIKGTDNKEYFFHRSAVKNADWDALAEGGEVSAFEDADGPKGPRAEDVFIA